MASQCQLLHRPNSVPVHDVRPLPPARQQSCPSFRRLEPSPPGSSAGQPEFERRSGQKCTDESNGPNAEIFLDECPALLDQVPDSFDLGLTPVRLCSMAASANFVAIGSTCGALFLFNRRVGQSVRPLRTNYHEVVSAMQFFHSPEVDLLAVGHRSGTLVLLSLPSESAPLLSQHVLEEAHKGSRLSALCWSSDGEVLFSGDCSGMVLMVHIDFPNGHFPVDFLSAEQEAISGLAVSAGHRLVIASGQTCKLVDWHRECQVLATLDLDAGQKIVGITLRADGEELIALLGDGQLMRKKVGKESKEPELLGQLTASSIEWPDGLQLQTVASADGELMAAWAGDRLMFCWLEQDHFGVEEVEISRRTGQPDLQILSLCISHSSELFLLTSPGPSSSSRVFRVGTRSPAPASLCAQPPRQFTASQSLPQMLSPLLAAGKAMGELQRAGRWRARGLLPGGTEQLLGKLNRELDTFLLGDGAPAKDDGGTKREGDQQNRNSGRRMSDFLPPIGQALPEQYRPERLAQGLQQMLGQFRQSSSVLSADFDHWSLAGTSREMSRERGEGLPDDLLPDSLANRSLPTELSASIDEEREELMRLMMGEEEGLSGNRREEVMVSRKRIRLRRGTAGASRGETGKRRATALRALAEERRREWEEEKDGEEDNNQGMAEQEAEERAKQAMEVLRGEEETTDGQSGEEEREDDRNSPKEDGKEEQTKDEHQRRERTMPEEQGSGNISEEAEPVATEDAQSPTTLDLTDLLAQGPPSSCSMSPLTPPLCPSELYQSVGRLAATDTWTQLAAPFPVAHFAVCRHFLVVCSVKCDTKGGRKERAKQRPQFVMCSALRNRTSGGPKWTQLRADNADAVEMNDAGTLLWRVSDGIGYAPVSRPEPLGPSVTLAKGSCWWEMTARQHEGNLIRVALIGEHAWYLTDRGVFVQMYLPEMGILHNAWDEEGRQFSDLAASEFAVWALSRGKIVARAGLRHGPMGTDWAEDMDGQPAEFVSIALFQQTGFALDALGCLWFVRSVTLESPFGVGPWLKACSLPSLLSSMGFSNAIKSAPKCQWRVKVCSAGLFLHLGPSLLLHCVDSITGHSLEPFLTGNRALSPPGLQSQHFSQLCAGGLSGGLANDCIFLFSPHSDQLLALSIRTRRLSNLPALSHSHPPRAMSATAKWLFVLGQDGLTKCLPLGLADFLADCDWTPLEHPEKFASIVVSSVSIWAISSTDSTIWSCRFDPSTRAIDELDWNKIAGPVSSKEGRPDKIFTSPSGQAVWLFCTISGLVWTRTDLSERNWLGRGWTQVSNAVRISSLAVGDNAIWAISQAGDQLIRLHSHSAKCLVGIHWQPLDHFQLSAISVDNLDGRLWALDSRGSLLRHEMDVFFSTDLQSKHHQQNGEDPVQLLNRSREMPERTLSGNSVGSWCDLTVSG